MKILLVLPAAENVRVTRQNPAVPKRNMLRFARSCFTLRRIAAFIGLRLNLTYRYDNLREGIVGAKTKIPRSDPDYSKKRWEGEEAAGLCR